MDCNTCYTEKDYLYHGFTMYTAFYGITLSVMLVMGSLSASHTSQFWKYVLIFSTGTLEALMLVSSSDPFHGTFFPWRTTAERIAILRSLSLALYMAISQLGPLHFPAALDGRSLRRLLVDLNNVTDMQTKESKMAFKSSFTPFVEEASLVHLLHRRMEKLALDTKLETGISKLRAKTK